MGITTPTFQASRKINNGDSGTAAAGGKAPRVVGVTLNFPHREKSAPAMRPVIHIP